MIETISKGTILIAKPVLSDQNFDRSVVLLVEHDNKGTIGFVMNKKSNYVLSDLLEGIYSNQKVYEGGPVGQENIYFIHSRPDLIKNSVCINENLYWSGNFEDVKENLQNKVIKENEIRFFIGYSGWSESQLELECKENVWLILEEKIELNSFEKEDYFNWQKMIKKLGGDYLIWINAPFNPQLN